MKNIVNIKVRNRQSALQELGRLDKKIKQGSRLTLDEMGDLGKAYARSIVPYYSGETYRKIRKRKDYKNYGIVVLAGNPTPGKTWSGGKFNLVRWMHTSAKAKSHIKSGDAHFMFTTRDYLASKTSKIVTRNFNKVLIK